MAWAEPIARSSATQNAEESHIVNTSSINGFWASVGSRIPHTAYSAAKFAVKGFTEALITDLRINARHIKCSVVLRSDLELGFEPRFLQ